MDEQANTVPASKIKSWGKFEEKKEVKCKHGHPMCDGDFMICSKCGLDIFNKSLKGSMDLVDKVREQIFSAIRTEFKLLECSDEIETTQGKHDLWTPTDVALSGAYNEAVKKVEKDLKGF